ncbi:unnamed protein product [Urochloa decumbens]|uniref:F-box domain-containing protein n=1 Tax=Urochloa decumbens TaxID=240449 RepID=A0ABC9CMQ0_9POAL
MARRGRPSSPAPTPPPDNDDILSEILLRLAPAPSSLPRASLVCKRWRRLVTDPAFLRRFRARHRRGAPLLGFFTDGKRVRGVLFTPTLEPPDRLPRGCFSFQPADEWRILSCRHGLVLLIHSEQLQVLVWDPVTGDQRRIAVPPGLLTREGMMVIDGAVLRATGDVHGGTDTQSSTFQVVLLCSELEFSRAFACVYSSENGVWSDPLSISYPPMFVTNIPSALVGSSLYWYLIGDSAAILEFDLDRQRLALIDMPYGYEMPFNFCLIPADGGVLGFLCVSNHDVYLWKRTTDGGGAAVWVLDRTIELNNLLPLSSHEALKIHGFAEDGKVLLIGTTDCIFTIQLESMKFARFSIHLASLNSSICHPFSSVYTSGMGLGDEQGNELLLDTSH